MKNLLLNLSLLMVCGYGLANTGNEVEVESVLTPIEDLARECCTKTAQSEDGTTFSHTTCFAHIDANPCQLAQAAATLKAKFHDLKYEPVS